MIVQALKMAWKSISANKMRSFLTMLGIIIGVMALVVLVSLVSTTNDSVKNTISKMGTDYLTVTVSDDKGKPLRIADIESLAENDAIGNAAPLANATATAISSLGEEEDATLYGTTGPYATMRGLKLDSGRFINKADVDNHTYVTVVNAGFALNVMGRTDVVGETVKLDGIACTIIGVLAADDADTSSTENIEAYVPYTTLVRISSSTPSTPSRFVVTAASADDLQQAENVLEAALLKRFSNDEDAFKTINQATVAEAMSSVTNTLALLLGGIAAISLLVGGIGIMNIMLVSVTERTREIGIRKAIGASRSVIMLQFLIEALVVSLIGCAIGIVLSGVALLVISAASGGALYLMSPGVVLVAVIFTLVIGVVFGLYPANKAARMKPIDALRFAN